MRHEVRTGVLVLGRVEKKRGEEGGKKKKIWEIGWSVPGGCVGSERACEECGAGGSEPASSSLSPSILRDAILEVIQAQQHPWPARSRGVPAPSSSSSSSSPSPQLGKRRRRALLSGLRVLQCFPRLLGK